MNKNKENEITEYFIVIWDFQDLPILNFKEIIIFPTKFYHDKNFEVLFLLKKKKN